MFESITQFFRRFKKSEKEESKSTAKERLHLVLAQDRANISADFLEMMKQEILEVIKKYIDIDEKAIDVRLTNKEGEDGSMGAPALYANIPIITIKNEARKLEGSLKKEKSVETESHVKKDESTNVENENDLDAKIAEADILEDDKKINKEAGKEKLEERSEDENKETKRVTDNIDSEQEHLDEINIDEVDNEEKNS